MQSGFVPFRQMGDRLVHYSDTFYLLFFLFFLKNQKHWHPSFTNPNGKKKREFWTLICNGWFFMAVPKLRIMFFCWFIDLISVNVAMQTFISNVFLKNNILFFCAWATEKPFLPSVLKTDRNLLVKVSPSLEQLW